MLHGELVYPRERLPLTREDEDLLSKEGLPNCIILLPGGAAAHFYLETPLPASVAMRRKTFRRESYLRPDIVVFLVPKEEKWRKDVAGKKQLLLRSPSIIVECKESKIWPRTQKTIYDPIRLEGRKITTTHLDMLRTYARIFRPKRFFVVSMRETPIEVVRGLRQEGIEVINQAGYSKARLRPIISAFRNYP
jgi:hypothetical protein